MIRKSKDYPEKIANEIRKAMENGASVKQTQIPISKGLWNCGSMEIKDNVCESLGIKPWDAPFTAKINDDNGNYFLLVTFS